MTETMVERVARAIVAGGQARERERVAAWPYFVPGTFYATPWGELEPEVREEYLAVALDAIEAMRKPSAKMLRAASKSMSPGRRPTEEWVSDRAKHGIRYRAMIDAALSQKGE